MENQENKDIVEMQIRRHRGGLDESVATMQTIPATLEAIQEYMRASGESLGYTEEEIASVKTMPYSNEPETRIPGWDGPTYMVVYRNEGKGTFAPFGLCSKMVGEEAKAVTLIPELAEMIARMTPRLTEPVKLEYTMEKAQNYVRDFLLQLINSGLAGNVMENSLKLVLKHPAFERYTTTTREERETLPTEVELDLRDFECRLADARFVFETVMKMVADPKGIEKNFELMRTKRDIPIHNEAATTLGCNTKYYIGLRGKWGWLHLYNGN